MIKRTKNANRIISAVLSLTMIIGSIAMGAFGASAETDPFAKWTERYDNYWVHGGYSTISQNADWSNYWTADETAGTITRQGVTETVGGWNLATLYSKEKMPKNFMMQFDFKHAVDARTVWVGFGKANKGDMIGGCSNGVAINLGSTYVVYNQDKSLLANGSAGTGMESGKSYSVTIKVFDNVITLYRDGTQVFSYTLSNDYESGYSYISSSYAGDTFSIPQVIDLDKYSAYWLNASSYTEISPNNFFNYWNTDNVTNSFVRKNSTETVGGYNTGVIYYNKIMPENFVMEFDYVHATGARTTHIGLGKQNIGDAIYTRSDGINIAMGSTLNVSQKAENTVSTIYDGGWSVAAGTSYKMQIAVLDKHITISANGIKLFDQAVTSETAGYVYFASSYAGDSISNLNIYEMPELVNNYSAYYASDISTTENLTAEPVTAHWDIKDNMLYRNNFDYDKDGSVDGDNWSWDKKKSILYYNKREYTNFDMTVNYYNRFDNGFFVGFGSQMGISPYFDDGNVLINVLGSNSSSGILNCRWITNGNSSDGHWIGSSAIVGWDETAIHTFRVKMIDGTFSIWMDGNYCGSQTCESYSGGYIYFTTGGNTPLIGAPQVMALDTPNTDYDSTFAAYHTDTVGDVFRASGLTRTITASDWFMLEDGRLQRKSDNGYGVLYTQETYDNFRMTVNYTASQDGKGAMLGFGAKQQGDDWYNGVDTASGILRIHNVGQVAYAPNISFMSFENENYGNKNFFDGWFDNFDSVQNPFNGDARTAVHTAVVEMKYNVAYVWIDGKYEGSRDFPKYDGGYIFLGAFSDDVSFGIPTIEKITMTPSGNADSAPYGKTALFVGDSISDGAYDCAAWARRLGFNYNMTIHNSSIGGATLAYTNDGVARPSVQKELNDNIGHNYDYIVIEGGINDIMVNSNTSAEQCKLGEIGVSYDIADFDTSTFAGSLEALFYTATTSFGNASVGYIMTYKTVENWIAGGYSFGDSYVAVAQQICDKWGVSFLNMWNNSTIDSLIDHSVNNDDLPDGLHLSISGYDKVYPCISSWFEGLTQTKYAGYGDCNNDGNVNILDLIRLKKYLADADGTTINIAGAKVAGNENVGNADMVVIKKYLIDAINGF